MHHQHYKETMPVKKYRKLPVVIEAIQYTGEFGFGVIDEIQEFAPGKFSVIAPEDRGDDPAITAEVYDYLHSTWVGVKDGDYIIKGLKGEFYPNDGPLFPEAYEEVQ